MSEKKLAKGCLVRLNVKKCFTTEQGGGLEYPMTNYLNDERGTVESHRPVTREETEVWYNSDASKGMDSAGESKLPPQSAYVLLHRREYLSGSKSTLSSSFGWGNQLPEWPRFSVPSLVKRLTSREIF